MKKGVGSGVGSGSGAHPDPLVIGTDPAIRIRIRTKISRVHNTAVNNVAATMIMRLLCVS
jgi:hypothetical protein